MRYGVFLIKKIGNALWVEAGRNFKLFVKNRVIMVLRYYRLYITYTQTGFLFDLDQSNVCIDIEKVEGLIRLCLPIPQKLYHVTKRLKTKEEVEKCSPIVTVLTQKP